MSWIAANLAPLMFAGLVVFLFTGVPVAFALVACGLSFALLGIHLGVFPPQLLGALPLRVFGVVANELLLAIPFFTFMGLVLQRSGMAEDLLETIGQVFGPVRGGLSLAVVFVGALLGATTGVVAASVISMGLISLPIMLRYGYNRPLACGVIAASGTLALVVPPSLVFIVVAVQLGISVGDLYAGALLPAALVIGLYAALVVGLMVLRPDWMPALPQQARKYGQRGGGYRSLLALSVLSSGVGWLLLHGYPALLIAIGRDFAPPADEVVIVGLAGGMLSAFLLAVADAALRLHSLSTLARRVAFVLLPPLLLIFLVLGTIFLGVATPTEGGAMGAAGAVALAAARGRLTLRDTAHALLETTKLSTLVMFVLIGATVFSLAFTGVDGNVWVERLFADLPGGATGFLVFVTVLVFVLGFFLDFFEIAFILLPLLAPIVQKLGIDMVWFGVLMGVNLQTSFMTPPFGFSLFFLRGVAPRREQDDPRTGRSLPGISTGEIYLGVLPFVAVQFLVMALMIAFPSIVRPGGDVSNRMNPASIERALRAMAPEETEAPAEPVPLLPEMIRRNP